MVDKQSLLVLIQEEIQQENALIARLTSEDKMAYGTFENWSPKDLLAHISSWKALLGANLNALSNRKNLREPLEDDKENAMSFEKHRTKDWIEVMAFIDHANQLFIYEIGTLSSTDLEAIGVFPWEPQRPLWRRIITTGYVHPILHLSENAVEKGHSALASQLNLRMANNLASLDESPAWQGMVKYNLACHYSLTGQSEIAIETLKLSLALNPELIEWSKNDPGLNPIHEEKSYQEIYKS